MKKKEVRAARIVLGQGSWSKLEIDKQSRLNYKLIVIYNKF